MKTRRQSFLCRRVFRVRLSVSYTQKYERPRAMSDVFSASGCSIGSVLFQFKRSGVELVVGALFLEQLFVAAAFNDASVVKDHYYVGVAYG